MPLRMPPGLRDDSSDEVRSGVGSAAPSAAEVAIGGDCERDMGGGEVGKTYAVGFVLVGDLSGFWRIFIV